MNLTYYAIANWDKIIIYRIRNTSVKSQSVVLSAHLPFSVFSSHGSTGLSAHPTVTYKIHVDIPLLVKAPTSQSQGDTAAAPMFCLTERDGPEPLGSSSIDGFPPWNVMDRRDLKTSRSLSECVVCSHREAISCWTPGWPCWWLNEGVLRGADMSLKDDRSLRLWTAWAEASNLDSVKLIIVSSWSDTDMTWMIP